MNELPTVRRGLITLSGELLEDWLCIIGRFKIIQAHYEPASDRFVLCVEGDELPETIERGDDDTIELYPDLELCIETNRNEPRLKEIKVWNGNILEETIDGSKPRANEA